MTSLSLTPDTTAASVCPVQLAYNHLLQQTANHPSSHAANHAIRVHNIALKLSAPLDPSPNLLVVRLAALLHDIYDHKMASIHGIHFCSHSHQNPLTPFLHSISIDQDLISHVIFIVNNISFSKQHRCPLPTDLRTLELDIVQDADRLDALGATGVARCFAFGAEKSDTIEQSRRHFDDKIFKLHDLMHTPLARRIASQRYHLMASFIRAMDQEFHFAGQPLATGQPPTLHAAITK